MKEWTETVPTVGEEQTGITCKELEFYLGVYNIHVEKHIHIQAGTFLSMSV